ncbi:MAG: excinuclease ABC subunit UvrC, partial [Clostridia bacterium]|nr:excinuclease ABC subunit UvrC [Clostridia bacterium]
MEPGVYLMRDKSGKIIYVGKARHLRNRVSQYFHDLASHTPKVLKMVENVADFEVVVAESEFDALVLENILIKKHLPKYNIKLKDDKGYPFIRVDLREPFPRFSLSSRRENDGARYYGPYGSRGMAYGVINTLSETLRLPTCSRVFPRDIGKGRPCLNAQMDRCLAPCAGKIGEEEYRDLIRQGDLILRGEYASLLASLEEAMNKAAEDMEFERAAILRDRIYAVRKLGSRQIIVNDSIKDADAVAYYSDETGSAVVLLTLRGGSVVGKFTVFTPDAAVADGRELLTDFLLQYYSTAEDIPGAVFLSDDTEDQEILEKLLSDRSGRRVRLYLPQRGKKHRIVDMAAANARDELERARKSESFRTKTAEALTELLSLPAPPSRIEAFDISNTG